MAEMFDGCMAANNSQRWARPTFFWVRNRNSATWRKHFRNRNAATFKEMFLRNRNSAIPQSQFFPKSATWELRFRNFRHILGVKKLEIKYFLPPGVVRYWEDFKGTVARDFRPLFLPWINPIWTPESHSKRFSSLVSNSNTPNLGNESEIHKGSIHEKKNCRPIILCYCPFNASFCFHWDRLL